MTFPGSEQGRDAFLKVFKDVDDAAQDASEADPFPAYTDDDTQKGLLGPFCPTSARRVIKALTMANVTPDDGVLDIGSGDGRLVTAAVAAFGAKRGLGIEVDAGLVELSRSLAQKVLAGKERMMDRIEFVQGDFLSQVELVRDVAWSVIVVFLLPDHTEKFADLLLHHYRRGARIVALVFNLNEIPELKLVQGDEPENIYVYSKEG
ncbi:hypothetical protein BDB00DRAFT_787895 [Zychaea mexicana]|uniref:uncharacterized protein n=1 Tax=Zychaea mexicana TaxID=64656 RepID=UPI0022FDD5AF|nr:uncharacterized protein BDB00DRAFT_787895 [Zychaea mexicana]KAI9493609.1 hypothetical protein BDB00DRAFT_787895 [Zychaea mexicana]